MIRKIKKQIFIFDSEENIEKTPKNFTAIYIGDKPLVNKYKEKIINISDIISLEDADFTSRFFFFLEKTLRNWLNFTFLHQLSSINHFSRDFKKIIILYRMLLELRKNKVEKFSYKLNNINKKFLQDADINSIIFKDKKKYKNTICKLPYENIISQPDTEIISEFKSNKKSCVNIVTYPTHIKTLLPVWDSLEKKGWDVRILSFEENTDEYLKNTYYKWENAVTYLDINVSEYIEKLMFKISQDIDDFLNSQTFFILTPWENNRNIFKEFIIKTIKRSVLSEIIISRFINKYNPTVVIVGDDNDPKGSIACNIIKNTGINSITVIHGLPDNLWDYWNFNADIVCVWSNYQKYLFGSLGSDISKCIVTGQPRFDKYFKNKITEKEIKTIGWAPLPRWVDSKSGSDFLTLKIYNSIRNVFKTDFKLIIRPHPEDKKSEYIKIIKKNKLEKFIEVNNCEKIEVFFKRIDILIGPTSSLVVEACLMNIPFIWFIYKYTSKKSKEFLNERIPIIKTGAGIEVDNFKDLRKYLKEIVNNKDLQNKLKLGRDKFLKLYYPIKDKATDNIVKIIENTKSNNKFENSICKILPGEEIKKDCEIVIYKNKEVEISEENLNIILRNFKTKKYLGILVGKVMKDNEIIEAGRLITPFNRTIAMTKGSFNKNRITNIGSYYLIAIRKSLIHHFSININNIFDMILSPLFLKIPFICEYIPEIVVKCNKEYILENDKFVMEKIKENKVEQDAIKILNHNNCVLVEYDNKYEIFEKEELFVKLKNKAEIFIKDNDYLNAFKIYLKLIKLKPESNDLLFKAGQIGIIAGKEKESKYIIEILKKLGKNDLCNKLELLIERE